MMGGVMDQQRAATQAQPLDSLVQMGFSQQSAINALEASGNDFNQALQILIDQREAEERNRRASAAERRATTSTIRRPVASATSTAARSALPPQLVPPIRQMAPARGQSESIPAIHEGGFAEVTAQMATQAQAIDTLLYLLRTIWDNPNESKYRAVKTTNARFLETLGSDPRTKQQVEVFMNKIGFERAGEWLTLPPNFNRSLLKQALEALEQVREGSAYQSAKRTLEFERALDLSKSTANDEELQRRAFFAAKLPPVPDEGAAGTTRISVIVSEGSPPLYRRFAADDTLADVVNWIGSERSIVCQKILDNSWVLVDETFLQKRSLDLNGGDGSKTLQALQLWPSATLHVRLSLS